MSILYELRRRRIDLMIQRYGGLGEPPKKGESFFMVDGEKELSHESKIEITKNYSDDFCVRVLNRTLSDTEENEWIKRNSYRIELESGVLRLGSEFLETPESAEEIRSSFVDIKVPSGNYIATVYAFYARLFLVENYIESIAKLEHPEQYLPFGRWFRETQPGLMFPPWLYILCANHPELDPNHIKDWIDLQKLNLRPLKNILSYVIQLSSSERDFREPAVRKLKKCPMGIIGKPANTKLF